MIDRLEDDEREFFETVTQQEEHMKMSQYAGSESKYLKASDLQGARPKVRILGVNLIEFEDRETGEKEIKPTISFEGKEKAMVCNKTNVAELINAFGDESEDWKGKEVMLSTKFYDGVGKEGLVLTAMGSDEPSDPIPF